MTRPVLGLTLAALFGLSLTVPCLTMGIGDELPMQPMAGCASDEEAPRTDLVCASSFAPSPSQESSPPASPTVAGAMKSLGIPSVIDDREASATIPAARGHAPPAYLLHRALLI